jgi:hypothetical protein
MRRSVLLWTPIFFIFIANAGAQDEDDFPRFEVGVHGTTLNLPAVQEMPGAIGGRFGYNFTEWIGIDSEFNYFPVKDTTQCISVIDNRGIRIPCPTGNGGHFGETQMLAGIKTGIRMERIGVFAKLRPGFVHFTDRQHMEYFNNPSKWRFAFDVGGVVEIYLNRVAAIRIDMGETFINFGGYRSIGGYPSQKSTNHGFQGGIGLMLQF